MRSFVVFILCCFCGSVIAQDLEYPDYRTNKESYLRVSDKVIKAELATFTLNGIIDRVGKLPLRKIAPKQVSNERILFETPELKVLVEQSKFDSTKKKMMRIEDHLVKINNKPFYGCYGSTPSRQIAQVQVLIGKDTVALPPAAYADLYDATWIYRDAGGIERSGNQVYTSADGRRYYIYLLNKQSSQPYEVTWVIQDKAYLRRVLDYTF